MTSVRTGIQAGWLAFNEKALVPMEAADSWDEYAARLFRYQHNEAYYHNVVYSSIAAWAASLRANRKLYKHIRGVYNPVARLVELYVAKVYGGRLDIENAERGAIPVVTDNAALRAAIPGLWRASNWGTNKSLYVRTGAMLGDVALKVVDDRAKRIVRLEVLHPGKIKDLTRDALGNITRAVIEYEREEDVPAMPELTEAEPETYTYTEVITPDQFATYKDGEPFAFFEDEAAGPVAVWPNEYGFVPLVLCEHRNLGMGWGASAFQDTVRKIDEVNDAATLLNDQIRKSINVLWYFAGVKKADEVAVSTDDKDAVPALYGPAGSQPFPMLAQVDIGQALTALDMMLRELERDMPELTLHRIRESGNMTAPGVMAGYSDAIDRIAEAQGNYDDALARAQAMAIAIGGYNGYEGYAGFSLSGYLAGDYDHTIAERPVVADMLSLSERLTFLMQSRAPQDAIWETMDVSADQRAKWAANLDAQAERFSLDLDSAPEDEAGQAGEAAR